MKNKSIFFSLSVLWPLQNLVIPIYIAAIWKKLTWKLLQLPISKSITEIARNFKRVNMVLGILSITEVCISFEPCFKLQNLVPIYPKNHKLSQLFISCVYNCDDHWCLQSSFSTLQIYDLSYIHLQQQTLSNNQFQRDLWRTSGGFRLSIG